MICLFRNPLVLLFTQFMQMVLLRLIILLSRVKKQLPEIPRVGMRMILKGDHDQMTWFGRGPQENYWDRKSGADIDLYKASVWDQYHPYVRAQETGNKSDVRWVALQDQAGNGLLIK